jgi:multidrug efflux pump subunit AcrA (membrane-fusion protein)
MRGGRRRSVWAWTAAIVGSGLVALGGCSQEKPAAPTANSAGSRKVGVTVAEVQGQEVRRTVQVVGTLISQQEVTLGTEVPSTVSRILVDLGDRVEAGQLLVKLDDREARLEVDRLTATLQAAREALARSRQTLESSRANVERAQAVLIDAQLNLRRFQGLLAEGAISASQRDSAQMQYDVAVAGLRSAEAQLESDRAAIKNAEAGIEQSVAGLELARKRLKDTDVISPIAGFVRKRLVNEGETFKEKTPLIAIVALQALKLQGEVPERFAPQVRVGHPVQVEVEAHLGRSFPGHVSRVSPVVDVENRSFTVEASIPNPQGLLRPGFFAKASIVVGTERNVPFAPENAVVSFAGNIKVFVVTGATVEERRVRTGSRRDGLVEILEGVKTGEMVATSNLSQLATGTAISVQQGSGGPAGNGQPPRSNGAKTP